MQRIIGHHDAGGYSPSAEALRAYHRLIDGDGGVRDGQHPITANAVGKALVAGKYAAHCLNLNSGSIGLAICAMAGASWGNPFSSTKYPVKPEQVASFVEEAARLCSMYGIAVSRKTVLTHAEVEITLGVKQKGKWDFDYDIFDGTKSRDPIEIGDKWRSRVSKRLASMSLIPVPAPTLRPTLYQGSRGDFVIELQRLLGLKPDGIFGPQTRSKVVDFQQSRQLLPDGIVGKATWAALGTKS